LSILLKRCPGLLDFCLEIRYQKRSYSSFGL
jgi:hypothetical protein